MNDGRLGVGFIGSGFNAKFHMLGWQGVRDADVLGVWSPNATNAAAAARYANELDVGKARAYKSIGEMVADLMAQENPTLGISAKRAQYELRIGAQADSRAAAEALADAAEATIRERLGKHMIGDGKLEEVAPRLLKERGLSLSLYEGNDRAPVYRALTASLAGRETLRGAVIHPLDRPADEQAAQSLARTGALAGSTSRTCCGCRTSLPGHRCAAPRRNGRRSRARSTGG